MLRLRKPARRDARPTTGICLLIALLIGCGSQPPQTDRPKVEGRPKSTPAAGAKVEAKSEPKKESALARDAHWQALEEMWAEDATGTEARPGGKLESARAAVASLAKSGLLTADEAALLDVTLADRAKIASAPLAPDSEARIRPGIYPSVFALQRWTDARMPLLKRLSEASTTHEEALTRIATEIQRDIDTLTRAEGNPELSQAEQAIARRTKKEFETVLAEIKGR
ncbi:MAG TPA: hypothetical protein VGP72_21260 [Planctomycetota bacterium]|jgi:hypothetical protein